MKLTQRWYVHYGLALAIIVGAVWARAALVPVMGLNVPYVTIYPAIMIVALVLGAGPGVFAALVGILLAEYHFMRPGSGIDWGLSLAIRAGIVVGTSLYIGRVGRKLRQARAKAEAEAAAARAAEAALRRQVELVDAARAEVIAREMQRLVRARQDAAAPPTEPLGDGVLLLPTVAGIGVAALGLLVLTGWTFDVAEFKQVLPGLVTMKASTALCFLLAGLALARRERLAWRLVGAAFVGAVAALSLAEYVTGASFGLDQLLFHDPGDGRTLPGRMAQATVVCFMLTSASLALAGTRARAGLWVQQGAALALGTLGLAAVLGYAYDVPQLYAPAGSYSMALHTALAFAALAGGLVLVRPNGLGGALLTPGPGGQLLRRLLPTALLLPAVLGWLHEATEKAGLVPPVMGTGLLALAMMLSLAALVWWTARTLDRTDAARREYETRLRSQAELMDHAREALIVREQDGAICFWNRGAEALYGWSAAEALGQRVDVLLRTEGLPADYEATLEQTGHWEGELVRTTRYGTRVSTDSIKTALRVDDGRVLILESNRDIDARKRAEAALRTSEERYRTLVDMAPGAVIVQQDGKFAFVNHAALQLYGADSPDQLLGRPVLEMLHPDDCERVRQAGEAALAGGSSSLSEVRILRLDGQALWTEGSSAPVDFGGRPAIQVVIHDTSQRKQAELAVQRYTEELQARNAELAQFNRVAVGREVRMVELKKEVNELRAKAGLPQRYEVGFAETGVPRDAAPTREGQA